MRTSPDRAEIEMVMGTANTSGAVSIEERNAIRRQAVVDFLDGVNDFNLEAVGTLDMTIREMILDDLSSYPQWEKS